MNESMVLIIRYKMIADSLIEAISPFRVEGSQKAIWLGFWLSGAMVGTLRLSSLSNLRTCTGRHGPIVRPSLSSGWICGGEKDQNQEGVGSREEPTVGNRGISQRVSGRPKAGRHQFLVHMFRLQLTISSKVRGMNVLNGCYRSC